MDGTDPASTLSALAPDIIVTSNIGCMMQLDRGGAPLLHLAELLDWASGGPKPAALAYTGDRPT